MPGPTDMLGFPQTKYYRKVILPCDSIYGLQVDGLNFERDGYYTVHVSIVMTVSMTAAIWFNQDRTNTNYWSSRLTGSLSFVQNLNYPAISSPGTVAQGNPAEAWLRVFQDSSGRICWISESLMGFTTINFDWYKGRKTTPAELQTLQVGGLSSEVIGKGSLLEVYGALP